MAILKRRRRPAQWMNARYAPLWDTARISFHRVKIRTGTRCVMPVVKLEADHAIQRACPDGGLEEVIYGLALRAHRLERQARRDVARIARLEARLAAHEGRGAVVWGKDTDAVLGLASKAVRLPLGDGWTFPFERDQGFLAVPAVLVADAVEDRRRS